MTGFFRALIRPFRSLLSGTAGAPGKVPDAPQAPAAPSDRGLIVSVGGVGGLDFCGPSLRHVLRVAGLPHDIQIFPWGHGFGRWFADLSNVANRDLKANLLADTVRRFRDSQPESPVFLVAKSGGCAVVVRALEQLADGSVERAILLAPALSPDYDLTGALRAMAQEMVVFWSPLDVFVLGAGTMLFGTMDRARTRSAGLVGFRVPRMTSGASDPAQASCAALYARLRQVRWTPRMAATGYLGGHVGPDSPIFLRNYVVPLLRPGPARES